MGGRLLREREGERERRVHRPGWLVAALFQTNDCSLTTSRQATRQVYINCSSDNTGWIRFIWWIKLGYGQQGRLINNVSNNRYSLHIRVSILLNLDSMNFEYICININENERFNNEGSSLKIWFNQFYRKSIFSISGCSRCRLISSNQT